MIAVDKLEVGVMLIDRAEMGKRLKAVRLYYGDSEDDTAKKVGVTAATVKRWEAGTSKMRTEKLRDFCIVYRVSSDYILGNKVAD